MEQVIHTLIARVNAGEPGAQDKLFAAACGELRKLARSRLRDGGRNTWDKARFLLGAMLKD